METNQLFKELIGNKLEARLTRELIKYAVQKQMFCPKTGAILDCRTAIMLEVYDNNKKLASSQVFSPTLVDTLPGIKKMIEDQLPAYECKFLSANKKLKNDLLTIIK